MPFFLVGSDECCSYRFRLTPGSHYLGRKSDCGFVIYHPSVSRLHAEVVVNQDGRVAINDLNSRNGTFVADDRIHTVTEIAAGDKIRMGSAVFTLEETPTAAETPQSPSELRSEQEFAATVQKKMINFSPVPPPGYEIVTYLEQCVEIGGDLFDVIRLPDGGTVLLLADVSGHGLGAALLMSHLLASFRTHSMGGHFDLLRCVKLLSKLFFDYSESTQFATLFMAHTGPENRQLEYINAGHFSPFVMRNNGTVDRLESTGPMVGALEDAEWTVATTRLDPGEDLLAFTDGLTEADCNGEQYGEERLLSVLEAGRGVPLRSLVDQILNDVDQFVCEEPRTDDLALLALRRLYKGGE